MDVAARRALDFGGSAPLVIMCRLPPKFLIVLALLGGCGAETTQAVLTIIEGDDNMPCLGVRRFRVTAVENEVDGKSVEVFG